jgi:hypothetical protein
MSFVDIANVYLFSISFFCQLIFLNTDGQNLTDLKNLFDFSDFINVCCLIENRFDSI